MMESLDRLAIAELLTRPNLKRLLEVLNARGEETRIVGGAMDAIVLHRVAEASVHRFVSDVAHYVRRQLA